MYILYMHTHIYTCMYECICMYVCMYVHTYVCMYVCRYVRMTTYVCMYVCDKNLIMSAEVFSAKQLLKPRMIHLLSKVHF